MIMKTRIKIFLWLADSFIIIFTSFLTIGSRQGFGVFVKTWEDDWQVTTAAICCVNGWLVNGFQPYSAD